MSLHLRPELNLRAVNGARILQDERNLLVIQLDGHLLDIDFSNDLLEPFLNVLGHLMVIVEFLHYFVDKLFVRVSFFELTLYDFGVLWQALANLFTAITLLLELLLLLLLLSHGPFEFIWTHF